MKILIKNISGLTGILDPAISCLRGSDMGKLSCLADAYLLIDDGLISDFGNMKLLPVNIEADRIINASGKFVFPSFCDSHTHLVYAGSREAEFADRIKGLTYEEIARNGGGILSTSKTLRETSDEEIYRQSMGRIQEIIRQGTGAVEIKSGYGLSTTDELRMLRIIRKIKNSSPVEVRSTFLGAHAIPYEYRDRRDRYFDLILNEMIPAAASEDLADFIDVFCEKGFFTADETERILMTGLKYGMRAKIHANELGFSGGVQVGVKYDALSVDHLECTGDEEINALKLSSAIPTLLPGSAFFLGLPDAPARRMIDEDLAVAMASDYNPGSSPSGDMKLVMSLGCIRLKMSPEEAINSVTINSACAMGLSETHGSVTRGKVANVFITKEIPSYAFMPYAFGSVLVETVILKGNIIE